MSSVIVGEHAAVVDRAIEQLPMSVIGKIRSMLRKHPWMEWMIPAALCAVMLGQLFLSVRQLSEICDESTHLYAGYRFLKCGDTDLSREHPPLARMIAAAPLLFMNVEVDCSPVMGSDTFQAQAAHGWLYSQHDWQKALSCARIAVSAFALGLVLLVWAAARRMFGLTTAVVATILLICEPSILANGALVMTDMPITFALFFAVFGFYLWVKNRTVHFLLLAGLATGLALLAKHSGVLAIPIICLLAIADAYIQEENVRPPLSMALRNLLAAGVVCVLAVGIVWAGYGMRFVAGSGQPQAQESQRSAASGNTGILLALENSRLLPKPYLEGFADALAMTDLSVPNFARNGDQHASSSFVLLSLAIRYSAAFLIMIPLAALGIPTCLNRYRREFLFLLVPATSYLAVCMSAHRIGGIRHLLPMFPFLLIVVAAGCVALSKRSRWVNYAVICLIVLHAASSLHAYPNYLSYANEFWGGPTKAYKYLPATDLGQGYLQARDYLERHPADPCWLLTDWQWNPGIYGVPCQPIGYWFPVRIPPRLRGTVIVSSTLLDATEAETEEVVAPFKKTAPKDSIGGSALLVYEGDFDTRAAAGRSAWHMALLNGPIEAALQHADDAVALAPESLNAHKVRCMILARSGQAIAAIAECENARQIARGNSVHRTELQQTQEVEQIGEFERRIRVESTNP